MLLVKQDWKQDLLYSVIVKNAAGGIRLEGSNQRSDTFALSVSSSVQWG